MKTSKLCIIGLGRMGKEVDALARAHGFEVVSTIASNGRITKESIAGAEIAIEFTNADSALKNIRACIELGLPVVSGTTGWPEPAKSISSVLDSHDGRVIWAPNFSLGVQVMLALVEQAGKALRGVSAFDSHLFEVHHTGKLDAPSGTAIVIKETTESALNRSVPVTSVRTGSVPGTHSLIFDAPFEQLQIVHETRDRRVFADGALAAARWLISHDSSGVFTMRDVLGISPGKENP